MRLALEVAAGVVLGGIVLAVLWGILAVLVDEDRSEGTVGCLSFAGFVVAAIAAVWWFFFR